jgi:hypothetical protein
LEEPERASTRRAGSLKRFERGLELGDLAIYVAATAAFGPFGSAKALGSGRLAPPRLEARGVLGALAVGRGMRGRGSPAAASIST